MTPNITDIVTVVGAHFGVAKVDILSPRREASAKHARHVCCWLAKN